MKKILLISFLLIFFLIGCNPSSNSNKDKTSTETENTKHDSEKKKSDQKESSIATILDDKVPSNSYYQFAIFGIDKCTATFQNSSKPNMIVIVSINKESKDIKLCSILPETYLNYYPSLYLQCDTIYARYGAQQTLDILNRNLDLDMQDYIVIDYKGITNIINELGGIQLEIEENDIEIINAYQDCIADDLRISDQYTDITTAGIQTLDGIQAGAYTKRFRGQSDDYHQTARQRKVITQVLEQSKNLNTSELKNICDNNYSYILTTFTDKNIKNILGDIEKYDIVDSKAFPFSDNMMRLNLNSNGDYIIPLDLETNVTMLHEFLFNDSEYSPSDEVLGYSEEISIFVEPYL